jgi:2-oxoisovalerate dehydrogenase E1 component
MTKDLHEAGDGQWLFPYPAPDQAIALGEPRVYHEDAKDLVVFTFGNGVPMALRAAKALDAKGKRVRVVDLRWLQPLNAEAIAKHARDCARILVLDEGRRSAGVGEGIITAIAEAGHGAKPMVRVVGEDTYTPLAGAATLVLPSDRSVLEAAESLLR